jgi:polar amino acid transport system substrate-binding protein
VSAAGRRRGRWIAAGSAVSALLLAPVLAWYAAAWEPPAAVVHRAAAVHQAAHADPVTAAADVARTAALKRHAAQPSCDPTASLRPSGPLVVTPGSFMAKIRARGYLIAGVDQNTYHFGYLDPLNGQIAGFDIDMLHAVAAAIFGNPNKIKFVSLSDAQRIPAVQSGEVDIVAHTMTITCQRLQQVDFSTVYFDATQRILVPSNSPVADLAELAWEKACATTGSTSLAYLKTTHYIDAVAVPYWTDCLVLLQQGDVAAISTDNSILAGLQAQDPFTKIVGPSLSNEPYGMAISKRHPDFVRFVNAVLARMRADGQWAASYRRWVGTPVPAPPPAHYLS